MRFSVRRTLVLTLLLGAVVLLPRMAWSQSVIAGVVTDNTGAVLPGVTVEAASPALIEKVRTATTDAGGRYSIVDLRPGAYSVTFTLAGFSTVKREGIDVASNVNVPVNAELRVGALEETITVTGASPVVDVQQAAQRQVLNREALDALPTSRSYLSAGAVVSGAKLSRPEMGGINVGQGAYLSARGKTSNDDAIEVDGMDMRISNGVSQSGYNNFAMVQDVTYQTSAIGADSGAGGVRVNMIPREGGNTFRGDFYTSGSTASWQASNLTDELKAKGLPTPDRLDYLYEANPSIGGPILRDKLWFFGSGRYFRNSVHPAGAHYLDGSDAYTGNGLHMLSGRLTWQPSTRNKITAYIDKSFKSQDETVTFTLGAANPAGVEWETATATYDPSNYQLGYIKWSSPITNKLLLDAGWAFNVFNVVYNTYPEGVRKERGTPEWIAGAPRQDLVTQTLRGGPALSEQFAKQPSYNANSSVSYVTGSHNLKTGVQWRKQLIENHAHGGNADLIQRYRSGVPDSVQVGAVPFIAAFHVDELAFYAMDSWTTGRLTVTPGIRFDYLDGGVDPSAMQPGRFVPGREVGSISPVPSFSNWSPRLSAVYDLFGNAKTALKFSVNRYMRQYAASYYYPYSPISQGTDNRNWFDVDLNPGTSTPSGRVLSTNRDDIAQDNEIGPTTNTLFGLAADRRVDPDIQREYSWDWSGGIQHELFPRVAVTAGWYYTKSYDAQRTRNALRSVTDYTPVQTTNPLTGEPMTIFNLNPAKLGQVDAVDANSDINTALYLAYEAGIQFRRENGGMLLFSWAMEQIRQVSCDTENANALIYCDQTGELYQELGAVPGVPFRHEFKLAGSHPLPWGFQGAASFLSYASNAANPAAGIAPQVWPLTVTWNVPVTAFPNGQRTEVVTVPLIAPGEKYLERWNQFDISVRRLFRAGRMEIQPAFEIYNLFNSSVVLAQNQNFGPTLDAPTQILQGRFMKLGFLLRF